MIEFLTLVGVGVLIAILYIKKQPHTIITDNSVHNYTISTDGRSINTYKVHGYIAKDMQSRNVDTASLGRVRSIMPESKRISRK